MLTRFGSIMLNCMSNELAPRKLASLYQLAVNHHHTGYMDMGPRLSSRRLKEPGMEPVIPGLVL